jgi:serine/threonine-protein kinase
VGYKICHEPHRNPSELNPQGVPQPFDTVVAKALAKKPEERYPSAREFASALVAAHEKRSAAAAPAEATILNTRPPKAKERSDTTFPPPGWKGEELQSIEELLAPYVGPMARVLVRKAAKTTMSGSELVSFLGKDIVDERDRKAFIAAAFDKISGRSGSGSTTDRATLNLSQQPIEPAEIEKAASQLAHYLGPIAKVVARKAGTQTRDLKTFYRQLAEQLANPDDRAEFLKKTGYE